MNHEALEREVLELYRGYAAGLLRYASAFLHGRTGAADAVQEVFLRYFIERSYGRLIANPRAWLYRVLHNYLLDVRKKAASSCELASRHLERASGGERDPETLMHGTEAARQMSALLSARELDCLSLRCEGLSYGEIAEVLGLSPGTVSSLLTRAYRKLRQSAPRGTTGAAEALRLLLLKGEGYSS